MKIAHYALAAAACVLVAIGVAELSGDRKAAPMPAPAPAPPTHPLIEPARVVHASGHPKAVVIYLSGQSGWSDHSDHVALDLASRGYTVIGIDSPAFLARLERADINCIHPVQPLVTLVQRLRAAHGWEVGDRPVLAGQGLGATIAYATIAQAVPGMFLGGVSYDYDGFMPGEKPWCSVNGFDAVRVKAPTHGWRPGATRQLPTPWRLLFSVSPPQSMAKMLAATPNARVLPSASEAGGIDAAIEPLLLQGTHGTNDSQPVTVTAFRALTRRPPGIAA